VDPTTARELGIDENDLWIAAHAALHNLVLVTADGLANIKEAIKEVGIGPKLEDWTKS
jgi:predicted nucleic acid-binding protein